MSVGEDRDRSQHREFLAEAEELLETLGQQLQQTDGGGAGGNLPAQELNALFRGMHSLKGLFGLLGEASLTQLTHRLEDFLDRVRMGEASLNAEALDVLFEAHELLEAVVRGEPCDEDRMGVLGGKVEGLLEARGSAAAEEVDVSGIDPIILRSLTRFEEHRLRESLRQGLNLFLVRQVFPLETFDTGLKNLLERLAGQAELISTLPAYAGDESGQGIAFRLLLASAGGPEALLTAVGEPLEIEVLGAPHVAAAVEPVSGADAVDEEPADEDDAGEIPLAAGRATTVRVELDRLDRILNSVGELILSRRGLAQVARRLQDSIGPDGDAKDLVRFTRALEVQLHELQRSVIGARMVPVAQMVGRLARLVRKLARRTGKDVLLRSSGESTELDKMMIDGLAGPLMHLVRNAVDHGLETQAERRAAGKPPQGTITLAAAQRGHSVVITLADDGRGVQLDAVRHAAKTRGLAAADDELDEKACCELIFEAGFSSAGEVGQISGRGVGLDAVRREIAALKGSVRVETIVGKGTTFEIELPITLAIIQCMLARAGDTVFAVPVSTMSETLRLRPGRLETVGGCAVLRLRGETVPCVDLRNFFALDSAGPARYVIVARAGQRLLAMCVDDLLGQQEVVIKPVGSRLERLPGIAGVTELDERRAALVLDVGSLAGGLQVLSGAA